MIEVQNGYGVMVMRAGKVLAYVIGGVIVLVAVALLAVRLFVNPNDYKGRIAAAVKESTGRTLRLDGDFKLTVFPWLGLEVGQAQLGNPPGFGADPMVYFQRATVRARLLPLLRGRLQVGRIEVDGLNVRLQRNPAGRGNWQSPSEPAAGAAPGTQSSGSSADFEGLAGISLKNARVSYQDSAIENLNLEIGRIAESSPKHYHIVPIEISGVMRGQTDAGEIPWKISAPTLDVDLRAQTLALPALAIEMADAKVTGRLEGTHIIDAPALTGAIQLAALDPRTFLARIGAPAPATRDPAALSQLIAATAFAYDANGIRLEQIALTLDQSKITGSASIAPANHNAMKFGFAVDKIDIDHYLSPAKTPAAHAAPVSAASPPAATAAPSPLKTLDANGTLTIGSLTVSGMELTAVSATLHAKEGVTRLAPTKAQLYGGAYAGDLTLDSRGATPALAFDQQVNNVDIARLLADSLKTKRLSGRGNVAIQATAQGDDANTVLKSLRGKASANVAGGALEGIDLWFAIGAAQALLQQNAATIPQNTGHTKFDALKLTANITDGVATTKDLTIASGQLRVAGQGSANLVTEGLDFHVVASLLNAARTASQTDIPIAITGTLADPKVQPDVQSLVKGQLKQKLQDTLKDKLKGLFGQ